MKNGTEKQDKIKAWIVFNDFNYLSARLLLINYLPIAGMQTANQLKPGKLLLGDDKSLDAFIVFSKYNKYFKYILEK